MFESIHLTNLRHNEFIQFVLNFLQILSKNDLNALKLQKQSDDLSSLLAKMVDLYKPNKGSAITKVLKESDDRRDKALVGIQSLINAYTYHFDPEIKKSAEVLAASLKKFGSSISKQNYQAETATISSIIDQWKSEAGAIDAIDRLSISDWVSELEDANVQFNTNYLHRTVEDAEQPEVKLVDLRKDIIESYRILADRIVAFTIISEDVTYHQIEKQLNELIEKYNATIAGRSYKKEKEEGEEEIVSGE